MSRGVETEYRYIAKSPGICGGAAVIRGTRTPVRSIAGYYKLGMRVDEILEGLPHLTPAQVFEALSYYYDNLAEIERDIAANQREHVAQSQRLKFDTDGRAQAIE